MSRYQVPVNLGWVLRQEGNLDGARSMFEAGLRISRRNGNGSGLAYASLGLACLAADLGDWHRAGQLHGAAQALLDRTGQRSVEDEARYRQDSLDQVRAGLGQEQFDRVYAHGTALSLEQALDAALPEHQLRPGCHLKRSTREPHRTATDLTTAVTSDRHAARLVFQRVNELTPTRSGWLPGVEPAWLNADFPVRRGVRALDP